MTEKEFLKSLGINVTGSYDSKGSYVVDIDSVDEWGKIYSTLEKSDLEPLESSNLLTMANGSLQYRSDEFLVTLLANFNTDSYTMTVTKL